MAVFAICGVVAGCQTGSSTDAVASPESSAETNANASEPGECLECAPTNADGSSAKPLVVEQIPGGLTVPDTLLVDEDGRPVRFYSDLVRDRIVAINFIFTTCKGVCPPMGANYALLQERLSEQAGDDVALISVSVDPAIDTPQRLKAWREQFGGGVDWTLVTGTKQNVDGLLKALQVFTADKNDHSPFILIGDDRAQSWRRVHGLTAAEKLSQLLLEMKAAREPQTLGSVPEGKTLGRAQHYFTDVSLVNQHGKEMKFYSDVLKDKVVVIHSFFSSCTGSCPVMLSRFAKLQQHLGDRLGRDVYLVSLTVDPRIDTSSRLKTLADQLQARPGWYFLTGAPDNVNQALYKLGHYVEKRENHSNIFVVGRESTGLWKKVDGRAAPEEIMQIVEDVLNEKL